MSALRPGKRPTAIAAPSGSPMHAASSVAVRLTRSDSSTIVDELGVEMGHEACRDGQAVGKGVQGSRECRKYMPVQFYAICT